MIARILLVLAGVAVALPLAEWLDPHAYIYIHLRKGGLEVPYLPGSSADLVSDEFRVGYEINALGFRDSERSVAKPPGVERTIVLGDSHAAGWGVEQDESFAARLEELLGEGHEVWNTAKHAGCPIWYVFQARDFATRFAADRLVVQLFDNDPDDSWGLRDRFPRDAAGRLAELPDGYRWEHGAVAGLRRWYRHRALRQRFSRLAKRLSGEDLARHRFLESGAFPWRQPLAPDELARRYPKTPGQRPPEERDDPGVARFRVAAREEWRPKLDLQENLLTQLLDESGERGIPVVLVYVPTRKLFGLGPDLEAIRSRNPHYRSIARLAEASGTPLVDLQQVFLESGRPVERFYFAHDGHLNATGHATVARALAATLAAP